MPDLRTFTTSPTVGRVDEAELRQVVADLARVLLVPGAVVLLRTSKEEVEIEYGVRARGSGEPVRREDHIPIGSITKTWTGTVILQMAEEGPIGLDDPVSKHLPNVPNGDLITITELLNMRSGLYDYAESLAFNQTVDREPQKIWTTEELVRLGLDGPVHFLPGEGFYYSNTNTVLLGRIAENIDQKPLARIFEERVLSRLFMRDSSFPESTSTAIPEPHPRGYMYGDNVMTMGKPPALPPEMQDAARAGTLEPGDQTDMNRSWAWAAGQGISNANDLFVLAEGLTNGTFLHRAMQEKRMASPRPVDPKDPNAASYGLGIAKFGPLYGHTGELPGFNAFMGHDPEQLVTLVVWTNLAPAVDGRDPAATIARAIVEQIYR